MLPWSGRRAHTRDAWFASLTRPIFPHDDEWNHPTLSTQDIGRLSTALMLVWVLIDQFCGQHSIWVTVAAFPLLKHRTSSSSRDCTTHLRPSYSYICSSNNPSRDRCSFRDRCPSFFTPVTSLVTPTNGILDQPGVHVSCAESRQELEELRKRIAANLFSNATSHSYPVQAPRLGLTSIFTASAQDVDSR
ncbi:hypothetical protein GGS23DRAFT_249264 [Durotheca rogersii]|uniref:uncharacterized protein n=1 Tax=Durotheca rogersii TaxID=419775 RepID=UPI00221E4574|nr:uncharacterized protein GGS23DRAFT_249264 [Durotheca rogersii]KAI5860104.1 hypothetical protein GGS23DRAFT_249264 [Durotheca rogersii]